MIKLYLDKENDFAQINVDKYKLSEHIKFTKIEDYIWKANIDFEIKYNNEHQDIHAICKYVILNKLRLINLVDNEIFSTYHYKSFSIIVCEDK